MHSNRNDGATVLERYIHGLHKLAIFESDISAGKWRESVPVNVQPVLWRRGLDLEPDPPAHVHADVRAETLDGGVSRAIDVPLGGGRARLAVLRDDEVGRLGAVRRSRVRVRRAELRCEREQA